MKLLMTKSKTFLIGWIALGLGAIMNGIYYGQSAIGLENIGLCIILFTLVIYLALTPLTYQQQKFSILSAKMNPEIQAIQKKYKGKTDQISMQKMNDETQLVYAKYGVNAMGSCLQLAIQMPILFALYQVIWRVPAYVTKVKEAFLPLANALMGISGAEDYMTGVAKTLNVNFSSMTQNTIIDVLYKFKPSDWTALSKEFTDLKPAIAATQKQVDRMNYFLGLNIADSPWNIIKSAAASGAILLLIGAVMIPLLAALTQWISTKISMSASGSSSSGMTYTAAQSMKTMNTFMPIMSMFFCLTLPVGMGLYWIAGAVIRTVQTVIINKKLEKEGVDEIIEKNKEKVDRKREKQKEKEGLTSEKMKQYAYLNTKNIDREKKNRDLQRQAASAQIDESKEKPTNVRKGSMMEKAMMVQEYDEKHKKK